VAILIAETQQPFRFLDIACGDAARRSWRPRERLYRTIMGLIFLGPRLDVAHNAVGALGRQVTLEHRDFITGSPAGTAGRCRVDWTVVASFLSTEKQNMMRGVRRAIGDRGLFLTWEPTSLDAKNRKDRRFELTCRPFVDRIGCTGMERDANSRARC
jgi:hypothetical protein